MSEPITDKELTDAVKELQSKVDEPSDGSYPSLSWETVKISLRFLKALRR